MKVLFLYTELAPYVVACLNRLAATPGMDLHVLRWPVNEEAPFELSIGSRLTLHDRNALDDAALATLAEELAPRCVFVSGWIDKGYLRLCRRLRKRGTRVVLCSDTAWRGDVRQWVAVAAARVLFPRYFTHAWVTGSLQHRYARRLGFPKQRIRSGFYAAETTRFLPLGDRLLAQRAAHWPRVLLCVARYIASKNQQLLCDAFAGLCKEGGAGDWELWLAGAGELHGTVKDSPAGRHPRIRHLGFVQADAMPAVLEQCGAFVLPSAFEPWGVVVHEHACAGFPLLLSDAVGAGERFLEHGINGYSFRANDLHALKQALARLMHSTDAELATMGQHSHTLAAQWGSAQWTATALELISMEHG